MDTETIASQLDDKAIDDISARFDEALAAKAAEARAEEAPHEDEYLNDNDEPDPPEAEPPAKTLDDQPVVLRAATVEPNDLVTFKEFASAFQIEPEERLVCSGSTSTVSIFGAHDRGAEGFLCMASKHVDMTVGERTNKLGPYQQSNKMQSRKAPDLHRLLAIYFDDIGEGAIGKKQAPFSNLPAIQSSWVVQTRPGNHQVGYLLAETSAEDTAAIMSFWVAAAAKVGSDKACVDRTRLARGPGGKRNGTVAQMARKDWHPEARYTLNELAEAFELPLDTIKVGNPCKRLPHSHIDMPTDFVHDLPSVLRANSQMFKEGQNIHDNDLEVTCPWASEHSDQNDPNCDRSYFSPMGRGDNPHQHDWYCHHSCKASKFTDHYLTYIGQVTGQYYGRQSLTLDDDIPPHINTVHDFAQSFFFVRDSGKYFCRKKKMLLPQVSINAEYGYVKYKHTDEKPIKGMLSTHFSKLPPNEKKVVDQTIFWPGAGELVIENSRHCVNEYLPNEYDRRSPDAIPVVSAAEVQPFLDHMAWMISDPRERHIVIQWLAHAMQVIEKGGWSLLLAGVGGVGKDALIGSLIHERMRAVSLDPDAVKSSFTGWLVGWQAIILDEVTDMIKDKTRAHKLKLLIAKSPDNYSVTVKGETEKVIPNIARFLLFSNQVDAPMSMLDSGMERRWFCVKTSPTKEDVMAKSAAGYFEHLIGRWWNKEGGKVKTLNYLSRLPLDPSLDFNGYAPESAYKEELAENSRSTLSRAIEEGMRMYPTNCPVHLATAFTAASVMTWMNSQVEELSQSPGGHTVKLGWRHKLLGVGEAKIGTTGSALKALGYEHRKLTVNKAELEHFPAYKLKSSVNYYVEEGADELTPKELAAELEKAPKTAELAQGVTKEELDSAGSQAYKPPAKY